MKKKKAAKKRPEPILRTLEFAGCWCEEDGSLTFRFLHFGSNFQQGEQAEEITFDVSQSGWEQIRAACDLTEEMAEAANQPGILDLSKEADRQRLEELSRLQDEQRDRSKKAKAARRQRRGEQ